MTELKIKKLKIDNFRAVDTEVCFGKHTQLSGQNKVGKTTVYAALLWLLTGHDNYDRANYKIFNTNVEYTNEINPETVVEGEFEIDGKRTVIKRTAKVKFTKTGSRTGSDEYKIFVDNVAYTPTEYKDYLKHNIADERLLRIMLNGNSFFKEDWKGQRKLLVELLGTSVADALKDKHAEIISEIESKTSRDKLDRYIRDNSKADEKESTKLTAQIEELDNQMEVVDEEIQTNISAKQKEVDEKQTQLDALSATTTLFDGDLEKLRAEFCAAKKVYDDNVEAEKEKLRKELSPLVNDFEKAKLTYESEVAKHEAEKESLHRLEEELNKLGAERKKNEAGYKQITSAEFSGGYCPTCTQKLPADQIEQAKKAFNEQKAASVQNIITKGKQDKDSYEGLEKRINDIKESKTPSAPAEPKKIDDIKTKLLGFAEYKDTDEGKEFLAKAKALSPNGSNKDVPNKKLELDKEIKVLNQEILDLKAQNGAEERNKKRETDKLARQTSQKEVAQRLAEYQRLKELLKEYDGDTAALMKSIMDKNFEFCNVVLQKQKKDGTWEDTCLLEYDGEYSVLNDGGRIIATIDVQKAFQKLVGVTAPLFVDRAESLTTEFEHSGQVVTLRTTSDKFLKHSIIKE